jgi:hypothetical protein
LIKRETYLAPKIPNKIWIERATDREQFSYRNFSRFEIEFELKIREVL